MEQEATTLSATALLVISTTDACWPSYWAAQICHALICLECQGKQSWILDIRISFPKSSLVGSAEFRKSWQLSGVLINCAGVYPLKLQWDCALSVSCLLGAEFSFKLLYLTEVLSHSGVSNEVQIRCNLQFYNSHVIFSVSVSSSETKLPLVIITSHSQICINLSSLAS